MRSILNTQVRRAGCGLGAGGRQSPAGGPAAGRAGRTLACGPAQDRGALSVCHISLEQIDATALCVFLPDESDEMPQKSGFRDRRVADRLCFGPEEPVSHGVKSS